MNTGFQQQQPLLTSASVRSAIAQQNGAHMEIRSTGPKPSLRAAEEKTFSPALKR